MAARCSENIVVRLTEHEHTLITGLAELRGMTASDVVRELIGFEREAEMDRPRLRLISDVEACRFSRSA
jgi:hypothetical protein